MHKQSLIRNVAIAAATAALLASCASSSKVMLGQARAPIDPAQVQVYSNAPVGSVEIAQLESTSAAGFGTQGQTDAAVQRLKREAAKLGANGVVIVGVGSERSGGGLSVGGGSYGGHVGGGLGIGIPTTQKRAAGVAIWVPAGRSSARHRMFRRRRGKARKIHLHQCTRARWMTVCSLPLRPVVLHPPELVSAWLVARE